MEKSNPAKQRIKEIEEGVKREFIETIQNSEEATSMVLKVLSSATEEIQMIFSRAITLKQYEKLGILNIVRKKAGEEVLVKILIGMDSPTNIRDLKRLTRSHKVELRYLNKSIQIQLTTIIIDRELSLVIEEKGDKDLNGFATYSNSESTIMSYASIFKNLWAKSTIYDSGMNAH